MTDIVQHFHQLQPRLTEAILSALALDPTMREVVSREDVRRFLEALRTAIETDNYEWMLPVMEDWLTARKLSMSDANEYRKNGQVSIDTLTAIQATLWIVFRQELKSNEVALDLSQATGMIFQDTARYMSNLETRAMIDDIENQMIRMRAEMARLDQAKTDFISVAAHELKTPLSLVEGYVKMLEVELASGENDWINELLTGSNKGLKRLGEIINTMLDISMIDNRMLVPAYQPVRLRSLLEMAVSQLEDAMKERNLTFAMQRFDDGGEMMYLDPQQMHKVFMNVLLNAIRYTPDGGRITVRAQRKAGFIEVAVADTGIGIDKADQHIIFEKFVRLGNVNLHSTGRTKFKGAGPGLGLTVAKGIMLAHGGHIWCESPGHDEEAQMGSIFYIKVPIYTEPPTPPPMPVTKSA